MNVIELIEQAYSINKANGWHEEKRDWEELCLLIVTEVAEAMEDYRNGLNPDTFTYTKKGEGTAVGRQPDETWKPCGIPSELADVLIRIADAVGLNGENYPDAPAQFERYVKECQDMRIDENYNVMPGFSFPKNLNRINRFISDASAYAWDIETLSNAYVSTVTLAVICNIDIERAVKEKLAYNATRGHRHGGKVI